MIVKRTYHQWIALALAVFSFGLAGLVSRTVFERLPHLEDEMAYLFQARTYARGNLVIESPVPSRAYWQPFVVDYDGHRFGKYTPGWPLQLMIGELMGQAWVINAFLAALTVALVYRLGREVYNPETGLIAAALVAFSPMALLLNATLMGHTAALFAAALFIYAYWRIERGRRAVLWGAVAGLALGLLVANRALTAVAVALPFVAWSGLRLLRAVISRTPAPANSPHPQPLSLRERGLEENGLPTATDEGLFRTDYNPLSLRERGQGGEGWFRRFAVTLRPLVVLGVLAVLLALIVPLYNYEATGDPTENLYTLVWSYDRIGFGEGSGRPHTLEKAVRHARFDLSLMAADLFGFGLVPPADGGDWRAAFEADPVGWLAGWRLNVFSPAVTEHLQLEADYYPMIGISWLLLPLGVILVFRWRAALIALWLLILLCWAALPFEIEGGQLTRSPDFAWLWLAAAFGWLLLPLPFWRTTRERWTWLLICVALSIIGVQMAYWIGSQRYSTRYYYESLASLALLSALPLAWVVRRVQTLTLNPFPSGRGTSTADVFASRPEEVRKNRQGIKELFVYALIGAALMYSLYTYSTPRIQSLYRFNLMSPDLIAAVEARRDGDRPVLVLVNGESVRWRAFGPLMAVTSPYLDSDIVAAWNFRGDATDEIRRQILERFPDRQVIEMDAFDNQSWFREETAAVP